MSSPPKRKRSSRSRSTTTRRRTRPKSTKEQQEDEKKQTTAAEQAQPSPTVATQEVKAPVEPTPIAEDPPVPDPVPQPVINTHLLPEEAPNIVTGYVRLITLGLSFFFAMYLGLEAFSIFVNFPTKLPISSLLITYGHLSDGSAAIALVGLLVAEVAAVQVWAWRTRRSSWVYEDVPEEAGTTPALPMPASTMQSATENAPTAIPPPPPADPVAPSAAVVSAPDPVSTSELVQPETAPASMMAAAQEASEREAIAEFVEMPCETREEPRRPVPKSAPEPAPPAISRPQPSEPAPPVVTAQDTPSPPNESAVAAQQVQVTEQEQKSGQYSQFEAQPAAAAETATETGAVVCASTTTATEVKQAPVSAPQSAEVRKMERPPPASASAPFVMKYQIFPDNPDVYVGIQRDPETGGFRYMVVEPKLSVIEKQVYQKLTRLLIDELEVDMAKLKNNKSSETYLVEEAKMLAKKYKINVPPQSYRKIAYYFARDYIKMGRIEVLMNDGRIEDVSCDGPKIPLFIWHRDYESIPTNVVFSGDEELNTFVSKLAYVSGKHISIASPIVDATLPDGSRIQITYGKEITKKGSTFTIRKFKGDPITIVDLLKYNTLSPELGAYLWYLIEKRMSLLVAGGTASGKTTTLNALSMFIPPDQKIVSVEDTPELNLSHKNWIQSITRGGGVAGEITLFDLLKAAMRQRPDIIIVGEVRGVEAFTLFQAIATGHGGLGTVHADSVEAAINRLTTEPMNVPKSLLGSTLDCLIMQLRIKMKDKSVRRMVHVAEIVGHESSTDQIVLNNAFKWDPVSDKYLFAGRSRLFDKITKRYGTPPEKIRQDIEDRKIFLSWVVKMNLRDYRDLSQQIREFYSDPNKAIERAMRGLEEVGA